MRLWLGTLGAWMLARAAAASLYGAHTHVDSLSWRFAGWTVFMLSAFWLFYYAMTGKTR